MEQKFQTLDLKIQQLSDNQQISTKRGDTEQDSHISGKSKDDDLTAVKLKIPPFHGRNDPEEFLDWVDEVDAKFRIRNYSDPVKFGLVVSEFKGYAMTWWNKFAHDRELSEKMPVDTWTDLKRHMRKRFVQPWYQRDMIRKMQTQGTRSVEDYFSEFESSLHHV